MVPFGLKVPSFACSTEVGSPPGGPRNPWGDVGLPLDGAALAGVAVSGTLCYMFILLAVLLLLCGTVAQRLSGELERTKAMLDAEVRLGLGLEC